LLAESASVLDKPYALPASRRFKGTPVVPGGGGGARVPPLYDLPTPPAQQGVVVGAARLREAGAAGDYAGRRHAQDGMSTETIVPQLDLTSSTSASSAVGHYGAASRGLGGDRDRLDVDASLLDASLLADSDGIVAALLDAKGRHDESEYLDSIDEQPLAASRGNAGADAARATSPQTLRALLPTLASSPRTLAARAGNGKHSRARSHGGTASESQLHGEYRGQRSAWPGSPTGHARSPSRAGVGARTATSPETSSDGLQHEDMDAAMASTLLGSMKPGLGLSITEVNVKNRSIDISYLTDM
jgi:hypothetical protein